MTDEEEEAVAAAREGDDLLDALEQISPWDTMRLTADERVASIGRKLKEQAKQIVALMLERDEARGARTLDSERINLRGYSLPPGNECGGSVLDAPVPLRAWITEDLTQKPTVTIEAELLDSALLCVIQHGRDRCALGWGKYPWGVLDAVKMLMRFTASPKVQAALADFEERLAR